MSDDPWGGGTRPPEPGHPYPYPQAGYPYPTSPYPAPGPSGRSPGLPRPVAFDVIPATPFGVAVVGVPATVSGPGAASLVAGVGSILVSLVVGCFGVWGADAGWGPSVAGAFAILAALIGVAALALGRAGLRQVRRSPATAKVTGRGLALAGLTFGPVGMALALASLVLSFSLSNG